MRVGIPSLGLPCVLAAACDAHPNRDPAWPPNVLIVVLDDVGFHNVGLYGLDLPAPPTPTLDALAAEGIRFRRAWSDPVCSPSRASILTGEAPLPRY